MNKTATPAEELRALRAASGHSAVWCAEHVGGVSVRSWKYWEAGPRDGRPSTVPADVLAGMRTLAAAVQGALAVIKASRASEETQENVKNSTKDAQKTRRDVHQSMNSAL